MFNSPRTTLSQFGNLTLCPTELFPDAVVSLVEPSLAINDMEVTDFIRERMSAEAIIVEISLISTIGSQRMLFGSFNELCLCGPATYQNVGTVVGVLDWLHDHERKRLHQLKLSLPSTGETMALARERIARRIAARKNRVPDAA